MGSPVSLASCSRICLVGLGVCEKAVFRISNCFALMVVLGPRLFEPPFPSSGDLFSACESRVSGLPSTEPWWSQSKVALLSWWCKSNALYVVAFDSTLPKCGCAMVRKRNQTGEMMVFLYHWLYHRLASTHSSSNEPFQKQINNHYLIFRIILSCFRIAVQS